MDGTERPDWPEMADRLEALAADLMALAETAPGEPDRDLVRLWSRSLLHTAIEIRFFAA